MFLCFSCVCLFAFLLLLPAFWWIKVNIGLYRRASLVDLYLHTKFHWNRRNFSWTDGQTDVRTYERADGHLRRSLLGRLGGVDGTTRGEVVDVRAEQRVQSLFPVWRPVFRCRSVIIIIILLLSALRADDALTDWRLRSNLTRLSSTKQHKQRFKLWTAFKISSWYFYDGPLYCNHYVLSFVLSYYFLSFELSQRQADGDQFTVFVVIKIVYQVIRTLAAKTSMKYLYLYQRNSCVSLSHWSIL